MTQTTKPTKQAVREYMERRTLPPLGPPPDQDEIRRQLGWYLLPQNRQPDHQDQE